MDNVVYDLLTYLLIPDAFLLNTFITKHNIYQIKLIHLKTKSLFLTLIGSKPYFEDLND